MIDWKRSKERFSVRDQRRIIRLLHHHSGVHIAHWEEAESGRTARNIRHNFTIEIVLEAYSLPLSKLVRTGFESAEPIGHLLLARADTGTALQLELPLQSRRSAPHVVSGSTVHALEDALLAMGVNGRPRSIRLLRIPSLHFSSVWAPKRPRGDSDQFVPYTSNFTGAQMGRIFSRSRIEKLLRSKATELILRWYERQEIELRNHRG